MEAYYDGIDGLPQDKTEALKYLNKAKEIYYKNPTEMGNTSRIDPTTIGSAYMKLEMKKEAVAFVEKEMTKIKKTIANLSFPIEPY